jgi:hypothetical protein
MPDFKGTLNPQRLLASSPHIAQPSSHLSGMRFARTSQWPTHLCGSESRCRVSRMSGFQCLPLCKGYSPPPPPQTVGQIAWEVGWLDRAIFDKGCPGVSFLELDGCSGDTGCNPNMGAVVLGGAANLAPFLLPHFTNDLMPGRECWKTRLLREKASRGISVPCSIRSVWVCGGCRG